MYTYKDIKPNAKTSTIELAFAAVGIDDTDLKNIITRHGDKAGAMSWTCSKTFDTNHPVGIRSMPSE